MRSWKVFVARLDARLIRKPCGLQITSHVRWIHGLEVGKHYKKQINLEIIFLNFIIATKSNSCQHFGGILLEGDDGKQSCYLYHKGRHIYDFEASQKYCAEFGGNLVTINGPKDQANVYRMIRNGIAPNKNSVL